jgi:hypothetical protein
MAFTGSEGACVHCGLVPSWRQVLVEQLPRFVHASLLYRSLDARRLQLHLATVEDAAHLRAALRPAGLVRGLPHLGPDSRLSSHGR